MLHEQEKQKEAYDNLKGIIDKAKKTKDYKTAQREVRKWKEDLHSNGFSLYSFDRLYRARVCTLLLLPSRELKNQEQATDELKRIKENGTSMDSKAYFEAISNWQNTYSISDFPDKLKKEINQITTEVFDSISQKRTSENAIAEIEAVLSSRDVALPANAIASILSKYDYKRFPQEAISTIEQLNMQALSVQESVLNNGISDIDLSVIPTITPTEAKALTSLRDILNKTPHDMDTILNWIYVNRKINYSEFARENIVKLFSSVGYKIPEQASYSIPEIDANIACTDTTKIDDLRKSVILNYLGIISQGNKLTIEGKDNLADAHAISEEHAVIEDSPKPTLFLEVFDTVVEQPEAEQEKQYDEYGEIVVSEDEEKIYNIFVEDILDNPLATYSITAASIDKSTDATVPDNQVSVEAPTSSEPVIVANNINIETNKKSTSSGNTDGGISLTIQDEENLQQAEDLSTYVIVASPILVQALTPKKERSHRKSKDVEIFK